MYWKKLKSHTETIWPLIRVYKKKYRNFTFERESDNKEIIWLRKKQENK